MAALVQSFPQQTGSVTMLQTRPSSSGSLSTVPHSQQHQGSRNSQIPRNIYGGSASIGSYRGHTSLAPVAPYAFTSTPGLTSGGNLNRQSQSPHLRPENRTFSAPAIPHGQQNLNPGTEGRQRYPPPASISTTSSSSSNVTPGSQTMDDSSIPSLRRTPDMTKRPLSSINLSSSSSMFSSDSPVSPMKPSPDRYRRNQRRSEAPGNLSSQSVSTLGSAAPSGSGMASVGHLYHPQPQQNNSAFRGHMSSSNSQRPMSSVDDMQITRPQNAEQAKRYRRRSMSGLETGVSNFSRDPTYQAPSPHPNTFIPPIPTLGNHKDRRSASDHSRPHSSHTHNGSTDSVSSTRSSSRPPSRHDHGQSPTPNVSSPQSKQDPKSFNSAPRTSEVNKRATNPSPLSKPMAASPDSSTNQAPVQQMASLAHDTRPSATESPAVQQLTALNNKEEKKKSRLRRAFSFGSASELQRASAQNSHKRNIAADQAKRNIKSPQDVDVEQDAIVKKQEAGGLGESIYSGQGNFYTGSTDNLSISSTASSASVMIRKMGQGVKKSTRSLVGLFRPKSVVGVPAADSPVPPSTAQVSMVTVEAERERVNVNVDPHDQTGGGTGFPKLERNSLDTGNPSLSTSRTSEGSSRGRRSIVGGERERAEVLAAVKKGILKRSGTDSGNSSPVTRPFDFKTPDFMLPNIPHVNDTPHSSAPSTPNDEQPPRSGHRRTDSIAIEGEDYFMSIARFASADTKSAPVTPSVPRNISFSPRIRFHDTWPSGEYDRRGEIATCNRLTPMLAQQIKEELNTFKMEMEVHESSKVYTHFF